MAKNHRVELRLDDEEFELLQQHAQLSGSMTAAVEDLLHVAIPTRVFGIQEVEWGGHPRQRFNLGLSNGMTVHGFLWSRGGQLLPPSIPNPRGHGRIRLVNGTREFWRRMRRFCTEELGIDNQPAPQAAADGELIER